MPKTRYYCYYTFRGEVECVTSCCGISDFIYGFWITESHQFTKCSDAKIWIPPTKIEYIAKVKEEKNANCDTDC